ncbi:MAG: DEAD/DEAH box helicase, partial [Kiritimatiellae bacterium]|nr:DEAD/DEAH box helicase [Kiritimatiellia bacterium]
MGFTTLGLKTELLQAITDMGFELPMPIQKEAIPVLLKGERDFIGLAQTGTGKTGAFGLALLQHIDTETSRTQGLVICPTRELCMQITEELKTFSARLPRVRVTAVYGGASIAVQINQIKRGAHIVVATPGRLLDLIRRKAVLLGEVSRVVLDEADEMLNMGFQEDIDAILSQIPEHRRIWLFSATMPREVARIAQTYLTDPAEITVGNRNQGAENIRHLYGMMHEKDRYQALRRLIDFTPDIFGLVFCRTRQETQTVAENLMHDGYMADALHGDMSQAQRDYVMRKFRQKTIRMLVATDVAARGLDVNDITHVVHYRLPDEPAIYTHRSGRTARAGKSGVSLALINMRELRRIRELEQRGKFRFEQMKFPSGRAICEKQLFALMTRLVETKANQEDIAHYLPPVYDLLNDLSKEELIQRLIAVEFTRFLHHYRDAADINATHHNEPERRRFGADRASRGERRAPRDGQADGFRRSEHGRAPANTKRFSLSAGGQDYVNKGAVVRLICE